MNASLSVNFFIPWWAIVAGVVAVAILIWRGL